MFTVAEIINICIHYATCNQKHLKWYYIISSLNIQKTISSSLETLQAKIEEQEIVRILQVHTDHKNGIFHATSSAILKCSK